MVVDEEDVEYDVKGRGRRRSREETYQTCSRQGRWTGLVLLGSCVISRWQGSRFCYRWPASSNWNTKRKEASVRDSRSAEMVEIVIALSDRAYLVSHALRICMYGLKVS